MAGSTPIPFKLFGLQRSGTNLAWLLILENFKAISLEHGNEWKHGYISDNHRSWTEDGQPVRLVICIKNPYSWLVSCYNYFKVQKDVDPSIDRNFQGTWDFAQFVQSPSYGFKNPIDRWNSLNRHWLEFPAQKEFSEFILHESMLHPQGQYDVLTRMQRNQHFSRRRGAIHIVSQKIDIGMQFHGRFDAEYYQNKRYLKCYSKHLLDFLNDSVDDQLLQLFGYQRISTVMRL